MERRSSKNKLSQSCTCPCRTLQWKKVCCWRDQFSTRTRQTLQSDFFFPFPIFDELHQTLCFFVSFVCSLKNQWFSTLRIVFHPTTMSTIFCKHKHGVSITNCYTVFKKRHSFWVVLRDTISFHQPNCQLSLCVNVSLCHLNSLSLCTRGFHVFLVCHFCAFWVFCCFWSEKREKKGRSQREKKKREKRVVFWFVCLGFWSGFFSFSPFSQTLFLSFSSLSSLCVLSHPFLSTT